jgi:tetratricopeptide (TPR) repeat protein
MTPFTLALLGNRVRKNTLVPFEKMHPSMALLPTAEDAATAFAEVFFAIQMIHTENGADSLERILDAMASGVGDKAAVERVTKKKWPDFERGWTAYLKRQPFPKELIPQSSNEKKELAADGAKKDKKPEREISFGDFAEVREVEARRAAHLGELMRERNRMAAATEEYEKAWRVVGNRYESISNKYALALLEVKQLDVAQKVLEGSLTVHPGSASTNVHLGRIALRKKDWALAKHAYVEALGVNPFDPEVAVALFKVGKALNDAVLVERSTNAAKALLDLGPAQLAEVAKRLGGDDLVDVKIESKPAVAAAPDAG